MFASKRTGRQCSELFGLDSGRPNHLAPLLCFVGNKLTVLGWRARQRRAAHVSEPRLDRGISKTCVNLTVEPLDDFGGRTLRRGNAEPRACLEARNKFC